MPMIDMPIEKLMEYNGKTPCPLDIDDYWDRGLAEMEAVNPKIELIPSAFQVPFAECFDLYFTGVRGARIHAKYLRPKYSSKPHPAILQFHGYARSCGEWQDKLNYVALGYSVAALDCRGQGGKSCDLGGVTGYTFRGHFIRGLDGPADNMLFRHIFLDTAQLAKIVMSMPEVDENRVGAMGISQGGGLTLVCAALAPRVRRLAPVYPFLCDYKRVWEMDLGDDTYIEMRIFFRLFDPLHEREEEIFTKLGYIDVQNLVKRIRGDVQFATGLMDNICPPSSQFAAYNKIKAPKSILIYPDYKHEPLPDIGDRTYQFMLKLLDE